MPDAGRGRGRGRLVRSVAGRVAGRVVQRAAPHRGAFDIVIVVVGVVATGLVSLVLEDLFPTQGSPVLDPWRWAGAAAAVAALVGLLAVRRRLSHDFGTLYYVSGFPGHMADRHAEPLRLESRRYLTYRIVRAWPAGNGTDQADHVRLLAERLNDAMNHDDVATGFHLAPNLLWDAALGVGGQLAGRPTLSFVELDHELIRWTPVPPQDPRGFGRVEARPVPGDRPGDPTVFVHLTADTPSWPTNWQVGPAVSVGVFDGDPPEPVPVRVSPVAGSHDLAGHPVVVHPTHAVDAVVQAICTMLHEHPGRPLLVVARLPKTLALAVGMRLAARDRPVCAVPGCEQAGCRDPWTALTPLRVVQEGPPKTWTRYQAVRVHPSQPPSRRPGLSAGAALPPDPGVRQEVRVVNLTPHDLVVHRDGRPLATIRRQAAMARLEEALQDLPALDTELGPVPLKGLHYTGAVTNLPEPVPGTMFVVSRLTAQAAGRPDLLFPGGEVRDQDNRIIGCEYLAALNRTGTPAAAGADA